MRIEVPEECQHQASDYSLEQQLLVAEQGVDQAEYEQNADNDQQQSGNYREDFDQGSERERNMRMWCG